MMQVLIGENEDCIEEGHIDPESNIRQELDECKKMICKLNQEKAAVTAKLEKALRIIKKNEYQTCEGFFVNKQLTRVQKSTLIKHVKEQVFTWAKFADNDVFEKEPKILQSCFQFLQLKTIAAQQEFYEDICKWIKYALVQKRKYVRDRMQIVFKGKKQKIQMITKSYPFLFVSIFFLFEARFKDTGSAPTAQSLIEMRQTDFSTMCDNSKETFKWYADEVLTLVNKDWSNISNRASILLTNQVTRTDEAFVLWHIHWNFRKWNAEYLKDAGQDVAAVESEYTIPRIASSDSEKEGNFENIVEKVEAMRKSPHNSLWETAFLTHSSQKMVNNKRKVVEDTCSKKSMKKGKMESRDYSKLFDSQDV